MTTTIEEVDLRLTVTKHELVAEDQRLWESLQNESISRVAGDSANSQLVADVNTANQGTESRLSTEVIHRSEGDLINVNSINALTQALSDYRIKTDLELATEKLAREQLGIDLNIKISNAIASFDHREHQIYTAIGIVQSDLDDKYISMSQRIAKYEDMLQDITTDSIQITMDNGEINMGAWTILSQAREWDLEILGKFKDYQTIIDGDLDQALQDLQNKLPVEQDIIDRAILALSDAPVIKDLDNLITGNIESIEDLRDGLATETLNRQNQMVAFSQSVANTLQANQESLVTLVEAESAARIEAIQRESSIRQQELLYEAQARTDEITDRIRDLEGGTSVDLSEVNQRVDEANLYIDTVKADLDTEKAQRISDVTALNNGLTSETTSRIQGDAAITTSLNNYKSSNDTALANVSDMVTVVTSQSNATAEKVTALDAELDATNAVAGSALDKAELALTETSSLAQRVTLTEASITGIEGVLPNKADTSVVQLLESKVNTMDGELTATSQAVTKLTGDMVNIQNDLLTKVDASVLDAYSTTVEMDNAIASRVQEYDANLVIGGQNVWSVVDRPLTTAFGVATKEVINGDEEHFKVTIGSLSSNAGSAPMIDTLNENALVNRNLLFSANDNFVFSCEVRANKAAKIQYLYYYFGGRGLLQTNLDITTEWVRYEFTFKPSGLGADNLDQMFGLNLSASDGWLPGDWYEVRRVQVQQGTKATEYQKASAKLNESIVANANAVSGIKTQVTELEGSVSSVSNDLVGLTNTVTLQGNDLANKAESSAVNNLKSEVDVIEGKVNSNTQAVIQLNNTVEGIQGDLENVATSSALQALASQVAVNENNITSNTSAITQLQNDLITTQADVATKANASVVSALDSKVTSIDNMVTTQGTELTRLENELVVTNSNLANKADSSAVSLLDSKVTAIEDDITILNASTIALDGRLTTTEQGLATKLDASALDSVYTEVETNNLVAGELSKLSTELAIGSGLMDIDRSDAIFIKEVGQGTLTITEAATNSYKYVFDSVVMNSHYFSKCFDNTTLPIGSKFTLSGYVRASRPGIIAIIYTHFNQQYDNSYLSGAFVGTDWVYFNTQGVTAVTNSSDTWHNLFGAYVPYPNVGDWVEFKNVQAVLGDTDTRQLGVEQAKQIKANSDALIETNTKVSNQDGRIQANTTAIQNLSSSLDVTNSLVQGKADSSVVNLLTSEVANLDNKVTVTNTAIESLTGRVAVTEQELTKKVDTTVLNTIYTKTEADAATIASVSKFNASLLTDSVNIATPVQQGKYVSEFTGEVLDYATQCLYADIPVVPSNTYLLTSASGVMAYARLAYYTEGKVFIRGEFFTSPRMITIPKAAKYLSVSFDFDTSKTLELRVLNNNIDSSKATAIETLTTDVSNIDGRLISQSEQITQLSNEVVSAKSDITATSNALGSLANKVTEVDGKVNAQGSAVTKVEANLLGLNQDNLLVPFKDNTYTGANYLQVSIPLQQPINLYTGDKYTVRGKVSFYHSDPSSNIGLSLYLDSYPRLSGVKLIQVGNDIYFEGVTEILSWYNGYYISSLNFYCTPYGTANSTTRTTVHWAELRKGDQSSKIDTSGFATVNALNTLAATVSAIDGEVDTQATQLTLLSNRIGAVEGTAAANSNALTTLNSQVSSIDGRVTAQASQITQLESTVGDNSAKLLVTSEVVDGMKASYSVKTDVNGLVSGFGTYNDGFTSAFGINADYFYVGKAEGGKKPFMVLTSSQTIGGVTYPAGTWIDVALIANATIGTAHIADASITNAKIANLDAAKITSGFIDADRIAVQSISADKMTIGLTDNLWPNRYFDPNGPIIRSNKAELISNITELGGYGMQLSGRDHIGDTNARIPVRPGDQIVIEYTAAFGGGPVRALGVGLWIHDDLEQGGNVPWQYGIAEQLYQVQGGWYRYRRTFTVGNNGSGRLAKTGALYFQIEQAENDPNPTYWNIGDVTVRRRAGGELIVDGSVTADKMNVTELSAITGTIGVLRTATTGSRMEIRDNVIKCYDGNTLRVQLGNLDI